MSTATVKAVSAKGDGATAPEAAPFLSRLKIRNDIEPIRRKRLTLEQGSSS